MDNTQEVELKTEVKTSRKRAAAESSEALSGERIKVKFRRNPEAGGASDAVYLGLNGTVYAYQFEKEVEVPVEVLNIADAAIIIKYESDMKGGLIPTEVARFPYQVIR